MIGLHCRWSRDPLPSLLADRFAASVGLGMPEAMAAVTIDGATLVASVGPMQQRCGWAPTCTARGDHLLFTGRIDNRDDIVRALPGAIDPSIDDAGLYGAAHVAWGDAGELRIVGEYAAILWSPDSRSVRLVRSPIQGPPLHYWHDDRRLIVASTARAIFATGEVDCTVDEQKIADALFLNYAEGERGWFHGVRRVVSGSIATIDPTGVSTRKYYDPFAHPPVRLARDDDYVEAAAALFEEASRAALRGFSRPAVSLSGGYDSQAVAAFAMQVMPGDQRLAGFSSVPEPGWDRVDRPRRFGDESAHVMALAAMHPRLDVDFVDAAGLGFDHKLDMLLPIAGLAPRNALNLHWIHEIRARARAQGCDVILTGSKGNATFSFDGSGAFPGWLTSGQWRRLARELLAVRHQHRSLARAVGNRAIRPLLPPGLAGALIGRHATRPDDKFATWCPLNPEWAAHMQVEERAADMGFDANFGGHRSTRRWRSATMSNGESESADLSQAMEVISGLPMRDPTAYRPLLEFCFAIPDDQYFRDGQPRWLAKRMLKGKVPDMVLDERRRGAQAADWHLRIARQRPALLAELDLLAQDPAMRKRLNLPRLRNALEQWPSATPTDDGNLAQALALAVTRAISTARFIRQVEGRSNPAPAGNALASGPVDCVVPGNGP